MAGTRGSPQSKENMSAQWLATEKATKVRKTTLSMVDNRESHQSKENAFAEWLAIEKVIEVKKTTLISGGQPRKSPK